MTIAFSGFLNPHLPVEIAVALVELDGEMDEYLTTPEAPLCCHARCAVELPYTDSQKVNDSRVYGLHRRSDRH